MTYQCRVGIYKVFYSSSLFITCVCVRDSVSKQEYVTLHHQAPREREACRSRLETAMHAHPECGCGRGPGNISARVIAMPSWTRAPPACVCRPRAIFLSPSVEFSSVPSRNRRIVLPACAPRLRSHRPTCMQHFPRVRVYSRRLDLICNHCFYQYIICQINSYIYNQSDR